MWQAIFYLVASFVLNAIFTPKAKNNQSPASQGDFDFPQAEEGTPQAVYFGECWSDAWMVLATGNYRVTEIRKSGGKK